MGIGVIGEAGLDWFDVNEFGVLCRERGVMGENGGGGQARRD